MGSRPDAILIAGPTASGKSALALDLAARLDGIVVNADSMQVYRDLRILTARPTPADERRVPHTLYGHIDGAENYSVSRWLADVTAAFAAAWATGTIPIVVGGTGLFFKALTQGLSEIPPVPPETRAALRAWAEGKAPHLLHAELARRDPQTALRLRSTDPQRLLRALEVHEATGESLSALQGRRRSSPLSGRDTWCLALDVDRATLSLRTDQRLDAMMEAGALDEVGTLMGRGLDPALPVMRALGVPQLAAVLRGETDLPSAMTAAKAATRHYLKRQDTFLRTQLPSFRRVAPDVLARAFRLRRQLA